MWSLLCKLIAPFILQQSYCQYVSGGSGAEITRFIQLASGNEKDLQTALAYVGPIAVAVDASSAAFRVGIIHRYQP